MFDVATLAQQLTLSGVLEQLRSRHGAYEILHHWTQGEFHHDLVLRCGHEVLVIATNCNGGVKEVLAFPEPPERWALWRWRCPDNAEFEGELPPLLARAVTEHFFDPCALLVPDARSELRPECRRRARGGGWEPHDA